MNQLPCLRPSAKEWTLFIWSAYYLLLVLVRHLSEKIVICLRHTLIKKVFFFDNVQTVFSASHVGKIINKYANTMYLLPFHFLILVILSNSSPVEIHLHFSKNIYLLNLITGTFFKAPVYFRRNICMEPWNVSERKQ